MLHLILKILINEKLIAVITSVLVFVVSIIIYAVTKNEEDPKTKKRNKKIGIIIDFIVLVFGIATFIIGNKYTIVPDIKCMNSADVIYKLNECDLDYNLEDLVDDGKITYSCNPEIGTIVKKDTLIEVVMLSKNSSLFFTETVSEIQYDSDYNKCDINSLSTFNTNTIDLYLSDIGVKLIAENDEYSKTIGQLNISEALVQLVNYETEEIIKEKISDQSGHIKFEEIPSGIYIFKVARKGYDTRISQTPFKLNYNPNFKEDTLSWSIDLLNNDNEFTSQLFQIKIVNKSGKPLIGKEFEIRAIQNGNGRESYTASIVHTNENGIVSLWHSIESRGITTDYYDEVVFELASDYSIDICDDKGRYITIDGSENKKVYELEF